MYTRENKPKENKSRAVANSVVQEKSDEVQGLEFVDNRPESIAQRKMQEIGENKSRAAANSVAQKKGNGKQGFGFVDNRINKYDNVLLKYGNKRHANVIQQKLKVGSKTYVKSETDGENHLINDHWIALQDKYLKLLTNSKSTWSKGVNVVKKELCNKKTKEYASIFDMMEKNNLYNNATIAMHTENKVRKKYLPFGTGNQDVHIKNTNYIPRLILRYQRKTCPKNLPKAMWAILWGMGNCGEHSLVTNAVISNQKITKHTKEKEYERVCAGTKFKDHDKKVREKDYYRPVEYDPIKKKNYPTYDHAFNIYKDVIVDSWIQDVDKKRFGNERVRKEYDKKLFSTRRKGKDYLTEDYRGITKRKKENISKWNKSHLKELRDKRIKIVTDIDDLVGTYGNINVTKGVDNWVKLNALPGKPKVPETISLGTMWKILYNSKSTSLKQDLTKKGKNDSGYSYDDSQPIGNYKNVENKVVIKMISKDEMSKRVQDLKENLQSKRLTI